MTSFRLNVVIIASSAILAPLRMILSGAPPGFDKGSWSFPWLMAGLCLFAVVMLVGMQAINPWSEGRWTRPTLYASPLRLAKPLQTFYIGALCAMAAGVGYFVLGIFDARVRWFWEPLSAGVGVWLGVRLYVWGFQSDSRRKWASDASAQWALPVNYAKGPVVKYRRIAVFSVCILLALLVPGALLACMLGWNASVFGSSSEAVGHNFHRLDHLLTGLAASLAYFCFLRPLSDRLLAHAVAAYVAVELALLLGGLVLGDSIVEALSSAALLTDALYAFIGLAIAYGWQRMTGKMARNSARFP